VNYIKLSIDKTETKVITFSRKTNILIYGYKFFQSTIIRTDSIKDLEIFLDSKFYIHNHINFISSHCIKLLGVVRKINFSFLSLECMFIFYFMLIRCKVEYASVLWNSVMSTDANRLECIQHKFTALCFNHFFLQVAYSYAVALEQLKLHTLQKRRYHLDALFLTQVSGGSKFCSSVLETASLRVLPSMSRHFSTCSVCSSSKNCPSAR
jgi:hypothetical protein